MSSMNRKPPYLFCGDDFTGASDTLATLSRAGLNCRLFLSPEAVLHCPERETLDAIGIATATRSLEAPAIAAELTPIGRAFAALGPGIVHYKVCSTFDSSPETGSIGAAVNMLSQTLAEARIMIIGGQPSLRRYCVFSTLFAAAVDSDVHRIDRHPTMAHHPVTPMTEADLRLLLTQQGMGPIIAVHHPVYREGLALLHQAVEEQFAQGNTVLFDVLEQRDLDLIGRAMHDHLPSPLLVVGSSSVAEAYLQAMTDNRPVAMSRTPSAPVRPVFIVAGSRSQATAAQVEHTDAFFKVGIDPKDIEQRWDDLLQELTATCLQQLAEGSHVLAVVHGSMDHGLTRAEIAGFTADLTSQIAFSGALDRLGIAGGDTSSLALKRLGADSLSFLADIEPGLCLCQLHSTANTAIDGLEIVLKGGQMGTAELFTRLTQAL